MNPIRETHSGGVLRVIARPGAWGSVPLALIEDVRLDLAARAVAIWLATRPAGWQISVAHLLSALHLGRDRWRRIAWELQSAGYLARSPTPSGPGGRWVWEIVFCAIPGGGEEAADEIQPTPPKPPRRAPPSAPPQARALATDRELGVPKSGTESTTTKEPPTKRECARDAHTARRPAGHSLSGGELVIDEQTGLHHNPRNARDAAALAEIRKFPASSIALAVAARAAMDDQRRAFPSAVLRHLRRQQQGADDNTPAWATGVGTGSADDYLNIIEGEAKWNE
jgi:hypothetical protein